MSSVSQNGTMESFDSSEFSLIPDPDQLPPVEEQNILAQLSGSDNFQDALLSAQFDLTGDEIQKRLIELAEDNRTLRESLQNSSAIMKNDLNAIASWHNNITTTIAQQEISLQESNEKMKELEGENEKLRKRLEETKPKEIEEASLKVENSVLSDEDLEYEIVQKKSKSAEIMKQELKEAELTIIKLQQEVEAQNLKIESMKEMYEENENETKLLKSKLVNHDELNAGVCDLLTQIGEFERTNTDLRAKVKDLQKQVMLRESEMQSFRPDVIARQREKEIAKLTEEHEKKVQELETKIVKLEEKLKLEEQTSDIERSRHAEAKKLLTVLQSNYDRVTKILQMQSRSQMEKDLTTESERESELRQVLEQVDNLTAKLFDLEQKLEESEEKVSVVTNELALQKEEAQAATILKTQVEVFKIDLDNAVLAKEAAQEEILQLTQQLKDLQAQNTATFCSNCGAGSAHGDSPRGGRGRRKAHGNKQSESRSGEDLFICPICQFGFTELQALENHVNNCLDNQ